MEQLPDDVILEILVRVAGIPDLFRCAATCSRWRLLMTDYSFLRRRWTKGAHHRSSLLGFFSDQPPSEAGIIPTPFNPAPWSPFGHSCRFPIIPVPGGCRAVPFTMRRGLLVVCFIPYGSATQGMIVRLAVCDPVTGKSRVLAPLKAHGRWVGILGCTVLTRADCCSNDRRWPSVCFRPDFFKVLIVSYANERYYLHVFTSGDSSWDTPIEFFNPLEHGEIIECMRAEAAVCQGTAHWLYKDRSSYYTLDVSTDETAHVSLTKLLPIAPDQPGFDFYSAPVLSVTNEGGLSLLRLYRKCTGLEIWTRRSGDVNGDGICWHLNKMIRLKRPEESKIDMVECLCVGEMSGVLLIKDMKNCMYIADLEAGTMENITELFRGVVGRAISFEMDWPTFFWSRLAGGAIKRTKQQGGPVQKVANSF